MSETTPPNAAKPADAAAAVQAHLLAAAKDDFVKRLDFFAAFIEQWTGHPERRPADMPARQLRVEWQREGVVMRRLAANIVSSGRSFVETVSQSVSIKDDHRSN